MVKIAVVIYSTYGHILTVSKAVAEGVKAAGADVDVYQLPSGEQNDASASAGLPIITPSKLVEYDGFLFGIPSRFGTHPYAFKAFMDATGAQWASGSYYGKYGGFFVTSGTLGGGQETVIRNSVSILAHHGILYVPLGYARTFGELTNLTEVHGGSPWGAGSIAGPSGARQPSKLELDTARLQGRSFAETVARGLGKSLPGVDAYGAQHSGAAAGAAGAGAGAGAGAASQQKSATRDANSTTTEPSTLTAGSVSNRQTGGAVGSGSTQNYGNPQGSTSGNYGAGSASGAGVGAGSHGLDSAKGEASNLGGESKGLKNNFENKPSEIGQDAKGKAGNIEKDAKAAPGKVEQAGKDTERNATNAAKQEKEGCCKCM